jgi:hypothetical protein
MEVILALIIFAALVIAAGIYMNRNGNGVFAHNFGPNVACYETSQGDRLYLNGDSTPRRVKVGLFKGQTKSGQFLIERRARDGSTFTVRRRRMINEIPSGLCR